MAKTTRFTDLKVSNLSTTTIRAFVKRAYEEKDYKSPYERKFILSDENGNTVEAYLSADIGKKYENDFKEGGYYKISDFGVYRVAPFLRFTNLRIEICFYPEITTFIEDNSMAPMTKYSFTDFGKVLDGSHYNSCESVDLLGVVVKVQKLDVFHDPDVCRPSIKQLRFTLRDVNGNELCCTAWGTLAYRFHVTWKHLRRRNLNICALRLWTIVRSFGKYSIHSRGGASDFWLNPSLYESYLAAESFVRDPQALKVDDEYDQE